ncbi:cupin-like domain-containing protein [Chryseobacterium sp. MEBOG06]|uniref:cupin-like domain-containing protein n=1 Tax=Chryseobacterium sp. MEBOG06 TaxID=2879938 RepID=UPI001F203C5B|nr:cupin-like domain-containing protein [Chryseobacterium sp. MEBOG06]UKB84721.1 cupin-like domain-containing protein [Chryseobacterium sp. MEBOG06]
MQQLIDKITRNNLTPISEDFSYSMDEKYFNEQYGYQKIPVVIRNAYQHWKIKEKWTLPYLILKLPGKESFDSYDKKLSLEEYLKNDFINKLYYKTQCHSSNELSDDYDIPDELRCWYKNYRKPPKLFLSWLYVGKQNTFSDLHQDLWDTSAWNYLIKGRKLWFFFPKSLNSIIKADIDSYKIQNIIDNILNNKDPKLQPLYCIQNEGDLVYTPSGYYHAVVNLDLTISLTENFINKTNYDVVYDNFKKNFDSSTKSLLEIIEYHLKLEKNGKASQDRKNN